MTDAEKLLWSEMAALTAPMCAGIGKGACRVPHSCCSPEYCDMALAYAAEVGEPLARTGHQTLPLMGPNGCTAAPHLRQLCTLHVCCVNSSGCNPRDAEWTKRYFSLRRKLELVKA